MHHHHLPTTAQLPTHPSAAADDMSPPPDPATVEFFVSLGEAEAALDSGLARCAELLDMLAPSSGGAGVGGGHSLPMMHSM